MPTSYDVVPYLGGAFSQTHPERLFTLARLFGMSPAPVDRCRVLEIGCGDGGNLIPMALDLKGSEYLGIDLAETPIAAGNEIIQELGLPNITLRAQDLMELPGGLGTFDYIIAHGLYSWIPDFVREKLMQVAKSLLAPQGVAYISYNVLPGCHIRRMLREMMQFQVRGLSEPAEIIPQAQALLRFLGAANTNRDEYHKFIQKEVSDLTERSAFGIFHDDLAEHYHPVYFHEFAAHARRYGLQYLSESVYFETQGHNLDIPEAACLRGVEDRIVREQYLDFAKSRRFRQTLLCHDEITLGTELPPHLMKEFYAASQARSVSIEGEVEEFRNPRHARMKTAHPLARAILTKLSRSWPRMLSFRELEVPADQEEAACEILLATYSSGLVDLHAHRPAFGITPGERPLASPLARIQAGRDLLLTTLRHSNLTVSGPVEKSLIRLLDGTRTRRDIALAIAPMFDASKPLAEIEAELEKSLESLGRDAILIS